MSKRTIVSLMLRKCFRTLTAALADTLAAMAEAIVKGEQKKLSACKPGKKDKNFDPIIAYMEEHPDEDGTKHIPTL